MSILRKLHTIKRSLFHFVRVQYLNGKAVVAMVVYEFNPVDCMKMKLLIYLSFPLKKRNVKSLRHSKKVILISRKYCR